MFICISLVLLVFGIYACYNYKQQEQLKNEMIQSIREIERNQGLNGNNLESTGDMDDIHEPLINTK